MENPKRVDLTWLDGVGVQQHIIGRLAGMTDEGMRVIVAVPLAEATVVRFRKKQGEARGKAAVVGCVGKGPGFVASFRFLSEV